MTARAPRGWPAALDPHVPEAAREVVRRACAGQVVQAELAWHRDDLRAELVVGLVAGPPAALVEVVGALAPAHAARVATWLAATPGILDVGFKIGHRGVQVYARAEADADAVHAGLVAAGVDAHATALRNLLALVERPTVAMVGLELDGEAADGAVYAAAPLEPGASRALDLAFGLLVRVMAPDQLDVWASLAPILLATPAPEMAYVSMATSPDRPWAKLDVGRRPLAIATPLLARTLGLPAAPLLAPARPHGDAFSHVGARFGGGMGPTFYLPVWDGERPGGDASAP